MISLARRGKDYSTVQDFYITTFRSPVSKMLIDMRVGKIHAYNLLKHNEYYESVHKHFQASICATFKKDPIQDGASLDKPDLDIGFINAVHDKVNTLVHKYYDWVLVKHNNIYMCVRFLYHVLFQTTT